MPKQARHAGDIVLSRRGYRAVAGGPGVWMSTARRESAPLAGRWSGYFVNDAFPDAVFDVTEWVDRGKEFPITRYAYQVRYCNSLHGGKLWQYRLDFHPLIDPEVFVPHSHDHEAQIEEHAPRPMGRVLELAEALQILEEHAIARIGPCVGLPPAIRGRAPNPPGAKHLALE